MTLRRTVEKILAAGSQGPTGSHRGPYLEHDQLLENGLHGSMRTRAARRTMKPDLNGRFVRSLQAVHKGASETNRKKFSDWGHLGRDPVRPLLPPQRRSPFFALFAWAVLHSVRGTRRDQLLYYIKIVRPLRPQDDRHSCTCTCTCTCMHIQYSVLG